MLKKSLLLIFIFFVPLVSSADEGMWSVFEINAQLMSQARQRGLKLKADQIYNEQQASLCDAIVAVDGGVGTGSVISASGLMITNHHVAYSDICNLSTPEHNYLQNGFWATSRAGELPVEGKTVTFLRRVVDITEEAKAYKAELLKTREWSFIVMRAFYGELENRYKGDGSYEVSCEVFNKGERYVVCYYETFKDVRMVAAPPASIGSFGGEFDNWGWPQHKGDFALYRIYCDKQGKPAEYSADNVPLAPRRYLSISTRGVHEGDYAMILGYPYRTDRYMSSAAIDELANVTNVVVDRSRHRRMEIIKRHIEADSLIRLKYAEKYQNLMNYGDYVKWQNKCLSRYDVIGIRAAEEAQVQRWIDASPELKAKYGTLIDDLRRGYAARRNGVADRLRYQEALLRTADVLTEGSRMNTLVMAMDRAKVDSIDMSSPLYSAVKKNYYRRQKAYDFATERELFVMAIKNYVAESTRSTWSKKFWEIYNRYNGNADAMANDIFDRSFCPTVEQTKEFFAVKRSREEILADPMAQLYASIDIRDMNEAVERAEREAGIKVNDMELVFEQLLRDFRSSQGILCYPNANSTMRLSYGVVGAVSPADAVHYDYRSSSQGILEKRDPKVFEYNLSERQYELLRGRDFGRWGEQGALYVNFLSNNDTSGGNSGSPVVNGRGELIGVAFDGNRESMAGDIYFQPSVNKSVNVDIRYVLWTIDKFAGATWILDELDLKQ